MKDDIKHQIVGLIGSFHLSRFLVIDLANIIIST